MATKKPNILILWGDDIGMWNISHFSRGSMGYRTPNIDRIAEEGVTFTDYYAQQSCTAGRACFITGQNPIRTGLTKVGMPGATVGLQAEDPTIAELLKPLGYATGQFGKNHLGDRNEYLPTVHGFDEFFGNLYHLNAEEEPELPDYPKDPDSKRNSAREASSTAWPRTRTIRPSSHDGDASANRQSRTLARLQRSAWKPSTRRSPPAP
jgi:arylsulfatase